jgi:hypothetical protein
MGGVPHYSNLKQSINGAFANQINPNQISYHGSQALSMSI